MSANVSFQATQPQDGAQQGLAPSAPAPESLPTLGELAERYPHRGEVLQRRFTGHPVLDIRPTDPEGYLERPDMPCWMRLAQPLCADGCLQQAALAYMSEGWLNASLAPAQGMLDAWQHAYISVLNQTLWFHSPELNVNEWILFVSTTVRGFSGRGLATTHLYQRDGRLLASMAQDVLMVARTA
jgi:acyl-CoA thioesterase-2